MVIDPGGSALEGARLREAIRIVTDRPIGHVTLTHVHPDHIFGAAAFVADHPEFIGHAMFPGALAQRGELSAEVEDSSNRHFVERWPLKLESGT